jgi:hypothetical protein
VTEKALNQQSDERPLMFNYEIILKAHHLNTALSIATLRHYVLSLQTSLNSLKRMGLTAD